MNYQETLEYLYNIAPMFQNIGGAAYKSGLENTRRLDELLGHPHRSFRSVHIAGTNGKGSVSQMIYSVLREAGYKTALYTSPHLRDFRERIVINGKPIGEQQVIDFVERWRPVIEELHPSFFELTTAMAFDHFRREEIDIAVVEVGMGGRLDCTNIITPMVSVITNISLDHTQYLGDTLEKIAAEKAGIIKPGIPAVIGERQAETTAVFIEKALTEDAPLFFAEDTYRCNGHDGNLFRITNLVQNFPFTIELGMAGDYQQHNLCTALAALDHLTHPLKITSAAVRRGLAAARVPGRWQTLSTDPCPIICDTGHNVAGLTFVTGQLARQTYRTLYFILGVVEDKDLHGILPLLPHNARYIFTQASVRRALPAGELARIARAAGLEGEIIADVPSALEYARSLAGSGDLIFVGGSTFTVAEVV